MTIKQAVKILRLHNEWRRGREGKPADPTKLGIAIDTIVKFLEEMRN